MSHIPAPRQPTLPTDEEVKNVLDLIKAAKRPVIHVGCGIGAGGEKLVELSKKLQIPLVLTGLAKGLVPEKYEGNLGYANRAACKAADEAFAATDFVEKALELSEPAESSPFFRAVVAANKNWQEYMTKMTNRPSDPLEFEAVYKEINRIAEEDALFSINVGDNIINSFRYLHLTPKEQVNYFRSVRFDGLRCARFLGWNVELSRASDL